MNTLEKIEPYTKTTVIAQNRLIPKNLDDAFRLAKAVFQSGMAPDGLDNEQSVMVAMMSGMEVGLSPIQAIQSVAVINNRPCLWGDGLLAAVRSHPKCEYIKEWIEGNDDQQVAFCETKRAGEPSPVKRSFSVDDAKRAGKWTTQPRVTRRKKNGGSYETANDSTWYKYPQRMLQMRARAWCLRDTYADVLKGIQVREEVEEYAVEPKDITPEKNDYVERLETAKATATETSNHGFDIDHVNSETSQTETHPESADNTTETVTDGQSDDHNDNDESTVIHALEDALTACETLADIDRVTGEFSDRINALDIEQKKEAKLLRAKRFNEIAAESEQE